MWHQYSMLLEELCVKPVPFIILPEFSASPL